MICPRCGAPQPKNGAARWVRRHMQQQLCVIRQDEERVKKEYTKQLAAGRTLGYDEWREITEDALNSIRKALAKK